MQAQVAKLLLPNASYKQLIQDTALCAGQGKRMRNASASACSTADAAVTGAGKGCEWKVMNMTLQQVSTLPDYLATNLSY